MQVGTNVCTEFTCNWNFSRMGIVDSFCSPVSDFWVSKIILIIIDRLLKMITTILLLKWQNGRTSCSYHHSLGAGLTGNNGTSCHDEVDFSLCFEDTAILYGICLTFWVLSGLSFFRGNGLRPKLDFGIQHALKLVSVYEF